MSARISHPKIGWKSYFPIAPPHLSIYSFPYYQLLSTTIVTMIQSKYSPPNFQDPPESGLQFPHNMILANLQRVLHPVPWQTAPLEVSHTWQTHSCCRALKSSLHPSSPSPNDCQASSWPDPLHGALSHSISPQRCLLLMKP